MIVYNPAERITRQTSRDNNLSNFSALKDPGDFFFIDIIWRAFLALKLKKMLRTQIHSKPGTKTAKNVTE